MLHIRRFSHADRAHQRPIQMEQPHIMLSRSKDRPFGWFRAFIIFAAAKISTVTQIEALHSGLARYTVLVLFKVRINVLALSAWDSSSKDPKDS